MLVDHWTNRIITRARRCGLNAAHSCCAWRRRSHRGVDLALAAHRYQCLDLAGAGVEHLGGATGLPGRALAVDEVRDLCGHGCPRIRERNRVGY